MIRITNIQHFCLQDGPGIRTTVFLKGCNLKCPWCANPECMSFNFENNDKYKGYDISIGNLESELLKDEFYYSVNDGGVTFSGGEALLQIKKLEPLLISLKNKNINICFETALMTNLESVKIASKYADEFLIDVKIMDKDYCKKVIGGNIDLFYNNLDFLFSKTNNIIFRIPLANEYTLNKKNIALIESFLKKYNPDKVEIFKVHNLAKKKYELLDKQFFNLSDVSDEDVDHVYNKLSKIVDTIEIISL